MIFSAFLLFKFISLCFSEISIKTNGGIHFDYVIEKEQFFTNESNIKFSAALAGLPDLPGWIKLLQDDESGDAILYGTPSRDNIGRHELEVIGLSRETYNTAVQKLMFTVNYYDILSVLHQFEFLVKNKDIKDMFQEGASFLRAVQQIWGNARYITLMEKVSERSPSVNPLPGTKEGVHIQIGGPFKPSSDLSPSACANINSDSNLQQVMAQFGFEIDWCKSKYISGEISGGISQGDFDRANSFYSTSMDTEMFSVSQENHILDVAYCFLPIIIGISFIVILTCVMCFNIEDEYYESDSSTNDGSVLNDKSYLPLKTHLPETPAKNGKLAYGDLTDIEQKPKIEAKSNYPKTSSRPPAYKMPPTKIPVNVYQPNKKMIVDTGI